jgi:hypothetical protein
MNDEIVKRAGNLFVAGLVLGMGGLAIGVVFLAEPSQFMLGLFAGQMVFASIFLSVAVAIIARELGGLRALSDLIMEHSAFRDPKKKRINGRWAHESDREAEQMLHSLEELQQEASR